jgi:hypothetical protein
LDEEGENEGEDGDRVEGEVRKEGSENQNSGVDGHDEEKRRVALPERAGGLRGVETGSPVRVGELEGECETSAILIRDSVMTVQSEYQ